MAILDPKGQLDIYSQADSAFAGWISSRGGKGGGVRGLGFVGLGPHRQRQGVLAVVEGVLKYHSGQHIGGAVVILDVVLKVLLWGKAANCGEHWSWIAQLSPYLKNSGQFRSFADKTANLQVSLGLCKPFLRLEEAFVSGRGGLLWRWTETHDHSQFLERLEVRLAATPIP